MRKTVEQLRMRLSIMKMKEFKATIVMKDKKFSPFIAMVDDFDFQEDEPKVVFNRCDETVAFPNDTKKEKQDTFLTYIKNIKSVDRYIPG